MLTTKKLNKYYAIPSVIALAMVTRRDITGYQEDIVCGNSIEEVVKNIKKIGRVEDYIICAPVALAISEINFQLVNIDG